MQITVNVTDVDLGSVVPQPYDGDTTLGNLVAEKLFHEFTRTDDWDGLRGRIRAVRDDEIRAQLAPIITEAINTPVEKTNRFGEPIGERLTLRELIVQEARDFLNRRTDDYSRSDETNLSKAVRAEVEWAFRSEIADVVKQIRAQVIDQIGETAKDQITTAALDAIKSR